VLKDRCGQSAWNIAVRRCYVELLEKMWDFAKKNKQQLKPEHLQNEVLLLKDKNRQTALHMAAGRSHVEILSKL